MTDLRVDYIFTEYFKNDTSFTEKSTLFNPIKYSQIEAKNIWHKGIKLGIEIGLNSAGLAGQKIELERNCEDKEFLEKFYKLCEDYSCKIQYHPVEGMCVIKTK